ncbi:MAG TPA: hypothetical protein PKD00_09935, partial [Burkholderiales bacterium]|nr:hypothetical protein [Burkholderiales bacterium]
MQDINQHQPSIGLNRDTSPEFQPDGTFTFALNALKADENIEALQNELSNILCVDLPYPLIGSIFVDNEFVLFLTDNITSEIGIFNPDKCTYTKIDLNCNLTLNQDYLVRGVSKVIDSCGERVVYWTDALNPFRYLNIDRADEILTCEDLNMFGCRISTVDVDVSV